MTLAETIERFDLPQILRHNARFDYEKLLWLQGEYARELNDDRFYELAVHAFAKAGIEHQRNFRCAYVKAALDTCKGKFKIFSELPGYAGFYFTDKIEYDAEAAKKDFVPENKPRLEKLRDAFAAAPEVRCRDAGSRAQGNRQGVGRESRRAGASLPPGRHRQTPPARACIICSKCWAKEKVMARIERATYELLANG